ncbi:hypothetical protein ACOSQ3_002105 [Xanthoceras sorbifolium]
MPNKNTVSTNTLISGYVKSGNLSSARELFDSMTDRTVVSWTILVGGYSHSNQFREAFTLFVEMRRQGSDPDSVTFATLLSGCNDPDTSIEVIQVHASVVKFGYTSILIVCNSLVDSYCKIHRIDLACQLFREMSERDSPSDFTFAAALCAGIRLDDIVLGQLIHSFVVKANFVGNVFVGNALLDFYSKHDCVVEARNFFDEMPVVNGVSYNVMITCYAWNEQYKESLRLFRELQLTRFDRRQFPFSTLLSIAADTLSLQIGRQIHSQAIVTTADFKLRVGNSLVDMYAKCGRIEEARKIFANLNRISTVTWTAMISGYVPTGHIEEGLKLFNQMHRADVSADQFILATILKATANLASIGFHVGSALLDMYAKCGSVKDAILIFQEMPARNIVSWNALISTYAQNGDDDSAGFQPDSVSFRSVLSACSHSGLVEEGLHYLNIMNRKYKLTPKKEHYASVIDMFCQRGRFDEAEKWMDEMPFEPDEIIWSSVLNSCRIHKNQELAKKAADQLFKMEKLRDAAPYVSMPNIYAVAGQWDSVSKVKKAMKDRGVKKVPACSLVEAKKSVHVFTANENSHPKMEQIRRKIEMLMKQMEKEGYKPDTSSIAFALISTPEGSPILVMKNLRACADSHAAIKLISKIVRREITVRYSSRFHHFKDGFCSCGDYW